VDLDTSTNAGAHVATILREVEGWDRAPHSHRPPRGRPGLAHRAPELAERIRMLRDGGESLQAIADALNEEGVPTPRGGDRWRPSSVQSALGYRRPRPPVPGMPPPTPAHPGLRPPVPDMPPARPPHHAARPPTRSPHKSRADRPPSGGRS
jgi:hypothetical protein